MITPYLKNVCVGGEIGRRLEMALRRLLREDEFPIRKGFTATPYTLEYLLADLLWLPSNGSPCGHWAADESGRYINVLSLLLPYAGSLYPEELKNEIQQRLERAVNGVLPLQRPEGYFGKEREEGKIYRDHTSGHNWLLRGLVEYYKISRSEKALSAAKKIADYYIKTHSLWTTAEAMKDIEEGEGKAAYVYSNYTHCIDGLVNLWQATREERYLELAKKIGKLVKTFEHAVHSHHFLSTLRGIINLYIATGDKFYLDRVEKEWEEISKKGTLPTGGVPEHYLSWTSDEGCSEADWAMINLYLWTMTQKTKYIETAEKVILNHLFWNQCANGGFSCNYGGGDFRLGRMGNHIPGKRNEAYWCCSMHCCFGLSEIARHIFTYDENTVWINLFNDLSSEFRMGDEEVKLEIETLYPLKGFLKLEIESRNSFELKIRKPQWLDRENVNIQVNGKPDKVNLEDGYMTVSKKGRRLKVEMNFPLQVRVESPEISPFIYGKSDFIHNSGKKLILYGPSILRPVEKVEDSEIIIVPENPEFRVENGLLHINLFGVKTEPDIEKKEKWHRIIFEPISQETFNPMDMTVYLHKAGVRS